MLIDFQIGNFRSMREPVTLSMVAESRGKSRALGTKRKRRLPADSQIADTWRIDELGLELLPVAVLFGGNASGKSNVWRALHQLVALLRTPRFHTADSGRPEPFLLAAATRALASTFRIRLWDPMSRDLITYELSLSQLVEREVLTVERAGEAEQVTLFRRSLVAQGQPFDWLIDPALALMEPLLRALNAETLALQFLLANFDVPPLEAIRRQVLQMVASVFGYGGGELGTMTCQHVTQDPAMRDAVSEFIQRFDTGVERVEVETPDGGRRFAVATVQRGDDGPVAWSMAQNSAGTQRLFELSAQYLSALKVGGLLSLDEFGAFLHPYITEQIIRLFQSREHNPYGAQLVVNTHDAHLLDNHLLRRDQVWLTERQADGSTSLVPLLDYKPRNDEDLMTRYLQGRYGGVPMLSELRQPQGVP